MYEKKTIDLAFFLREIMCLALFHTIFRSQNDLRLNLNENYIMLTYITLGKRRSGKNVLVPLPILCYLPVMKRKV